MFGCSPWKPVTAALVTTIIIIISNSGDGVSVFPQCVDNCTDVGLPGSYADCSSCARFFICVGRRTLVVTCPGFLYYDHVIGVCSYHKPTRCGPVHSHGNNPPELMKTGGTDNMSHGSQDESYYVPPASPVPGAPLAVARAMPTECINNCSDVTLSGRYADCNSCSRMIVCIEKRMTRVRCPPPLHYDPAVGVCNYHWKVNCKKRRKDEMSDMESRHAVRNDGDCIDDCSEVKNAGKHASCRSCSHFILCTGGKMFVLSCPKKLQFDSVSKLCTFASSLDCREEHRTDFFVQADDISVRGKTTSRDSSAGNKSNIASHTKSLNPKHALKPDRTFLQQMGSLLKMASEGTERPQAINSKEGINRDRTKVPNSMKKLFCETFNANFNMLLSLCDV